jgi:predicted nuclease with TOPRIM domain
MTALEIKSEMDKTQSRTTELETELTGQTASFEATQKAFVEGRSDVTQLHAEQSKMTLLAQAIEALRTTYQKLKSAFENQSADERRSELLKQMTDAANSVPALVDGYLKTRTELHELVSKHAEKLVDKAEAYRAKQIEYRTILAKLEPTDEEIAQTGLDQRTRTMAAATYFNKPPMGTFTEAVDLAENLLIAKLNKEAQAKRQAEYKSRTAAQTSALSTR